jgi:hypothetical protein
MTPPFPNNPKPSVTSNPSFVSQVSSDQPNQPPFKILPDTPDFDSQHAYFAGVWALDNENGDADNFLCDIFYDEDDTPSEDLKALRAKRSEMRSRRVFDHVVRPLFPSEEGQKSPSKEDQQRLAELLELSVGHVVRCYTSGRLPFDLDVNFLGNLDPHQYDRAVRGQFIALRSAYADLECVRAMHDELILRMLPGLERTYRDLIISPRRGTSMDEADRCSLHALVAGRNHLRIWLAHGIWYAGDLGKARQTVEFRHMLESVVTTAHAIAQSGGDRLLAAQVGRWRTIPGGHLSDAYLSHLIGVWNNFQCTWWLAYEAHSLKV